MKTIKYYILIIGSLFLTHACDLTEKPYGIYSTENMFSTEAGAQSVLLSGYRALALTEYTRTMYYADLMTDIEYSNRQDATNIANLSEWKVELLKDEDLLLNQYKTAYKSIQSACDVIENLPNPAFNESFNNRGLGEAYFLRGYVYYLSFASSF
jgi:hypothetical protein